jgi:hypothetical protein
VGQPLARCWLLPVDETLITASFNWKRAFPVETGSDASAEKLAFKSIKTNN